MDLDMFAPSRSIWMMNHGRRMQVEGPSEPSITQLADGRVIAIFREQGVSPRPMWMAVSQDDGVTWSPPVKTPAWAVWPQLLVTKGGAIVLASGRPGVGVWILPPDVGTAHHNSNNDDATMVGGWDYHNVLTAHNRLVSDPAMRYDPMVEKIGNWSDGGCEGCLSVSSLSAFIHTYCRRNL